MTLRGRSFSWLSARRHSLAKPRPTTSSVGTSPVTKSRQKFLEKKGLPRYMAKRLLANLARTEQKMAAMRDTADFFCDEPEGMDDETAWCSHELAEFEAAYKRFHNLEKMPPHSCAFRRE